MVGGGRVGVVGVCVVVVLLMVIWGNMLSQTGCRRGVFFAFFVSRCAWYGVGVKFEDLIAGTSDSVGEVVGLRVVVLRVHVFYPVAFDAAADAREVSCLLETFDCRLSSETEIEMPSCEARQD